MNEKYRCSREFLTFYLRPFNTIFSSQLSTSFIYSLTSIATKFLA